MNQTVRLAAVQVAAGQIAGPVGDLDRLEELTARAAQRGAVLVAWPECAYPAYFLRSAEHYRATADRRLPFDALLARLGDLARRLRIYLVAGVVEELGDGRLANAAAVFDPAGRRMAAYRKCFLWHFDHRYFVAGDQVPVVQTEFGRVGLLVCADGRCPELAAIAARQGARLIVNPTAWVSWGRRPAELTNPQLDYFIPARAMETGCWVLSANKVGVEADSIVYCGQSRLVDPTGRAVASLDSVTEDILVADAQLASGPADQLSRAGHRFDPVLFAPTDGLAVARRAAERTGPAGVVVAAVAGGLDRFDPQALLADLAGQSVRLAVVAGGGAGEDQRRLWMRSAAGHGIILCRAETAGAGQADSLSYAVGPAESFAPARAAMLNGAEMFIAAPTAAGDCPDLRLLRARAAENRMFLAAAAEDRAVIVGPTGAVLADSLDGRAMAVVANIAPAAADDKLMAPETDVVAGRNPALYARCLGQ